MCEKDLCVFIWKSDIYVYVRLPESGRTGECGGNTATDNRNCTFNAIR